MGHPLRQIKRFLRCEDGAITVDWVVLTGLIVGLAAPIGVNYVGQLTSATAIIATHIANQDSLLPP